MQSQIKDVSLMDQKHGIPNRQGPMRKPPRQGQTRDELYAANLVSALGSWQLTCDGASLLGAAYPVNNAKLNNLDILDQLRFHVGD